MEIKKLFRIIAFLGLIIIYGCESEKPTILSYLKNYELILKDDFNIITYNNSGITDFIFEFEIIVTESDSERIVNHIRSLYYYNNELKNKHFKELYNGIEKRAFFKNKYYYVEYYDNTKLIRQSMFFYPSEKRLKYVYFDE